MVELTLPVISGSDTSRRKRGNVVVERLDKTGSEILELLVKCYSEDHARKELEMTEGSGWRSLVFIAGSLRIPRSRVYGDKRHEHFFSETLQALIESEQLEYRVFRA